MEWLHEVVILHVGYAPRPKDWQAKLKLCLQRLEALELIGEDYSIDLPRPCYLGVDWSELSGLQRLAVPIRELMSWDPEDENITYRQLSLSESTHLLQIDVEWAETEDFIEVIDHFIQSPGCLRKIEVRFAHNLLTSEWAICKGGIRNASNGRVQWPGDLDQYLLRSIKR
jgi:hypothetical protein